MGGTSLKKYSKSRCKRRSNLTSHNNSFNVLNFNDLNFLTKEYEYHITLFLVLHKKSFVVKAESADQVKRREKKKEF